MVKQIIKMYTLPKVVIFADKREPRDIIDELRNFDCEVKSKFLINGDFVLSDRVIVERKNVDDFLQSVINHRIFKQLSALKNGFEKPVLLIEGGQLNNDERVPENVIRGALTSIALDFSIPILWTRDVKESAGLIYWIARREQIGEKREVSVRTHKKTMTLADEQEFLIAGLPKISNVRAREMLKHFGSPAQVFAADEKELAKVKKLGKVTAHKIRKVLGSRYRGKKT